MLKRKNINRFFGNSPIILNKINTKRYAFTCNICKSITCVWGIKYLNMDYIKMKCCSLSCKNKYINDLLSKNTNLPQVLIQLILKY